VNQSDFDNEVQYGQELAERLRLATESFAEFERFREDALIALGDEMVECERIGW
jgi:hypothetical protein